MSIQLNIDFSNFLHQYVQWIGVIKKAVLRINIIFVVHSTLRSARFQRFEGSAPPKGTTFFVKIRKWQGLVNPALEMTAHFKQIFQENFNWLFDRPNRPIEGIPMRSNSILD